MQYGRIERTDTMSVAELQSLVCQEIDKDLEFWWDCGDPQDIKAAVQGCTSIQSIMDMF